MSHGIDVPRYGESATFSNTELAARHSDDPVRGADHTGAQNTRLAGRPDVDFYWNHPVGDGQVDSAFQRKLQVNALKVTVSAMKLYGSLTSLYVREVCICLMEKGLDYDFVVGSPSAPTAIGAMLAWCSTTTIRG